MRTRLLWGISVGLMILVPRIKIMSQAYISGARSSALGGVSAGLEEVWAVSNNPAGLARLSTISLATCLEQRYLLKETGYYGAALSLPAGNGCLGAFTRFCGYRSWIEESFIVGYGMTFSDNLQAGVSLVYDFQKAGNESRALHQVSYGLGTIVTISPRLKLAFATFNPFRLYYRSNKYASLPSVFRLGISYRYSDAFALYSEIDKDLDLPLNFRLAAEYIHKEIFFLRSGISFFPFKWAFGTAIRHHRYLFEISADYHQYLGFTPAITLQYDLR